MAGNQTKSESTLIKKVGDIANVMAAAGVGFTEQCKIAQAINNLFVLIESIKASLS